MPLIIICGFPSSGKTTRAKEIKLFLEKNNYNVFLINEESLNINRNDYYGKYYIFYIYIIFLIRIKKRKNN